MWYGAQFGNVVHISCRERNRPMLSLPSKLQVQIIGRICSGLKAIRRLNRKERRHTYFGSQSVWMYDTSLLKSTVGESVVKEKTRMWFPPGWIWYSWGKLTQSYFSKSPLEGTYPRHQRYFMICICVGNGLPLNNVVLSRNAHTSMDFSESYFQGWQLFRPLFPHPG